MKGNSSDAVLRDTMAQVDDATLALAAAYARQARVFADAAELGVRKANALGATSWREAEEPIRALAERLGAAVNMDAREVRRLMNDALLARRAREKTRIPSIFRRPAVPGPGH